MTEFEQKVADALADHIIAGGTFTTIDGLSEWLAPRVAAAIVDAFELGDDSEFDERAAMAVLGTLRGNQ